MKAFRILWTLAAAGLLSTPSLAQFVKGNEAVTALPEGGRKVETPPLPSASLGAPCPAVKAGCAAGGWKMLESKQGLIECTEVFARPGTCRPSTYGKEKRSRVWIVKLKGEWRQCVRPDVNGKCVKLTSFPTSAVQ